MKLTLSLAAAWIAAGVAMAQTPAPETPGNEAQLRQQEKRDAKRKEKAKDGAPEAVATGTPAADPAAGAATPVSSPTAGLPDAGANRRELRGAGHGNKAQGMTATPAAETGSSPTPAVTPSDAAPDRGHGKNRLGAPQATPAASTATPVAGVATPHATPTPQATTPPAASPTSSAPAVPPGRIQGGPGRSARRGPEGLNSTSTPSGSATPASTETPAASAQTPFMPADVRGKQNQKHLRPTPITPGATPVATATETPSATPPPQSTAPVPSNHITPPAGTSLSTKVPSSTATPLGRRATPFVPKDLPETIKDRTGKGPDSPTPPANDATATPVASPTSTATPQAAGETKETPAATKAPVASPAVSPADGKPTPFVPADMPDNLKDKRPGRVKPTPASTATPAETSPTPNATPNATASPTASPSPATATTQGTPVAAKATPAGPAIDASTAPAGALTGAAAALFNRSGEKGKKRDAAKPKLTPFGAGKAEPNGAPGQPNATNVNVAVYNPPPAGSTPTPTPAPKRIKITNNNITNIVQHITLVPTPTPGPTPGATPVPTPPDVTPTPSAFHPEHNWRPYPGWKPAPDWKPPVGYVPPGGWTPPPGWQPPNEEWRQRVQHWGWRYIARRGWVVDVRWVPPTDFVVPPNWYYLPADSYQDYGFYNPGEVVVVPGRARPDLRVNINVSQPYMPPPPPPAIVEQEPPPPPREMPAAPIQQVAIQNVEEVAQVLTRTREPGANRYDGPVLVTGAIHFDYDDYSIKPESFPALDKIGEALTKPPLEEAIINVEGHTDSDGSDEYNQKLSERRAWSVKSYLVQKFGMDPNRLVVVGYGERAPIATNDTPEGKAQNRRVEFENVTDLYSSQVLETGAAPQQ